MSKGKEQKKTSKAITYERKTLTDTDLSKTYAIYNRNKKNQKIALKCKQGVLEGSKENYKNSHCVE